MAATDFIVAIELGSSKITGIAGKKHADGSIQVLALASENSSDFIRKGVIYNLDKTAQSLTSIIKKLESTLKASIGKVYVGIGGQSLRTIRNTEVRHLEEETKISQELIDSIMDSNREVPIIDQEILEVAPQEYKVGINLLADPVGVPSDHIEGRFLNIIARNSVKQNIDKCFKQAGIEIADYIISPLALANAVLTNSEKRSGCMFIDFGADTTTVSVYKNNILRHLAVIPLGGSNITKDICSQQIEEEDAEELKKKYGNAYADKSEDGDDNPTYSLDGKCSIESHLLEDIVEARVNEILANVWNQIVLSGYEDKLLAGAIITGGAANLKNMEEAFSNRTKVEKVRMAKESQLSLKGGMMELKKDGTCNTIIALLGAGKENCYRPERPIQVPLFDESGENVEDKSEDGDDNPTYSLDGKCSIESHLLEDIVEARVNEILANVWNQIVLSGYEDKLLAGAIITGGAANLKNMEEAFSNRTKVEKVRMAKESQLSLKGGMMELKKDGTCNTIIALLGAGKENCYRPERPIQVPLFDESGENVEDKRKREKEEAARIAAAAKKAEEEEKLRKATCESLIRNAKELKEAGKYKNALSQLAKARDLGVAEALNQIRDLEKEIKSLKEANNPIKRLTDLFGRILEE